MEGFAMINDRISTKGNSSRSPRRRLVRHQTQKRPGDYPPQREAGAMCIWPSGECRSNFLDLSCTQLWTYFRDGPSSERRPLSLAIGGQKKKRAGAAAPHTNVIFCLWLPVNNMEEPCGIEIRKFSKASRSRGQGQSHVDVH
jgi:hypothetical protein